MIPSVALENIVLINIFVNQTRLHNKMCDEKVFRLVMWIDKGIAPNRDFTPIFTLFYSIWG